MTFTTSPEIGEIAGALAKAQGAIESAKKDSQNPHFKSKYADLASVWEACRAQLSANAVAVVQSPGECAEGSVWLTTMLMHSSGQWVRDTLNIPLSKVDAQGYGSATTYARRYALSSMVGVAPDDDDGNAASRPSEQAVHNNSVLNPTEARQAPKPLVGKHKTRAALKQACANIAGALREAVDGGDPLFVDEALATWAEDLEQIKAEGAKSWMENPDWGLTAMIKQAYDDIATGAEA